ncbi:MAG: PVC-type heme-binding CxxCH protein [Planctomycetota bacterium]|nr:PVC-type heme-binding CxxCH protein [Planctomycetota bacterium]
MKMTLPGPLYHCTVLCCLLTLFQFCSHGYGQLTPQESLESLKTAPGLEASLFASEPLVNNPTAMDIDPLGRIWVTEGVNYRHQLRGNTQGQISDPLADRVKVLEDTTGDGRADRVVVFADKLLVPMGIAVSGYVRPGDGGKVFVGASPNLWVYEDADGDLVPEKKTLLLTGFHGRDHDHGLHGLALGPDQRLYMTVGDEGMDVTGPDGKHVQSFAGAMLRCDLDGQNLTLLADNFRNPYELTVNSFGEIFCSDNDIDGQRGVRICWILEGGNYGWKGPPSPSGDHWREDLPGYVHKILGTGNGSPCGILCYEGTLFGESLIGTLIHADSGPGVVRAYPLLPKGAGYRAQSNVLISSSDSWFRPVDVCTHPDGSILIADWYDAGVGGHRYSDNNTGRIYRLKPSDKPLIIPDYDHESVSGLLTALASPNIATRFEATRSLSKQSPEIQKELIQQTSSTGQKHSLLLRARVGWLPHVKSHLLTDQLPQLRAQAIRSLRWSNQVPLLERMLDRSVLDRESNPQVIRELLLCHNLSDAQKSRWIDRAIDLWNGTESFSLASMALAFQHLSRPRLKQFFNRPVNPHRAMRLVKIARELKLPDTIPFLKESYSQNIPEISKLDILEALSHIDHPDAGRFSISILTEEADSNVRQLALNYLSRRLNNVWKSLTKDPALKPALTRALTEPALAADAVEAITESRLRSFGPELETLLIDTSQPLSLRVLSATALGTLNHSVSLKALMEQVVSAKIPSPADSDLPLDDNDQLVIASLRSIGLFGTQSAQDTLERLLSSEEYPASIRNEATRLLGRTPSGVVTLLDLADARALPATVKGTATEMAHRVKDQQILSRAQTLLPKPTSQSGQALPDIDELAKRSGNSDSGRNVFERNEKESTLCARCHRVAGFGQWIGPDLSEIGNKLSAEAILDAILNPSAGISHAYRSFQITTKQGLSYIGLVVEETPSQLILKTSEGQRVTLPVEEIDERISQPVSLMPENLAATLSEQNLVDLVVYLQSLTKPTFTVTNWHVLGPLSDTFSLSATNPIDLNARHVGKNKQSLQWQAIYSDLEGKIDLLKPSLGMIPATVYLHTTLRSPKPQSARLLLDATPQSKGWINGNLISWSETKEKSPFSEAALTLQAGANELVIKVQPSKEHFTVVATLVSPEPINHP